MLHLRACVFLTLILLISCESDYHNYVTNYEILLKKEYPNKCVLDTSTEQLIMSSDETKRYPGKCADIYCGRHSWALIYECELQSAPLGCEFTEYINAQAAFPECCERNLKCNLI